MTLSPKDEGRHKAVLSPCSSSATQRGAFLPRHQKPAVITLSSLGWGQRWGRARGLGAAQPGWLLLVPSAGTRRA